MENLIEVLNRESMEYEELLILSQRKTPIIINGSLEDLQKITDEEQELVGRISHLEKQRVETIADVANVLNRDVNTLTLSNLIELMGQRPQEQTLLREAQEKLRAAVRGLQRVNEQNKELIGNALEMVEFEMNLMQAMKTAPETANYNRGAYSAGDTMGVNSSGFDAKQ